MGRPAPPERSEPPEWLKRAWKTIVASLLAAIAGTGGGAALSRQDIPPEVRDALAETDRLRAENRRLRDRLDRVERVQDDERERSRRTEGKVEDALGRILDLDKRTPKIQSVTTR